VADNALYADWSPDGSRIAFLREQADGAKTMTLLLVVDVGGGTEKELARFTNEILSHPRWSPDGRRIALNSSQGTTGGAIGNAWVVDVQSGAVRQFPFASKFGVGSALAWITSEDFLYFQSESVAGNGVSVSSSKAFRQNIQGGKALPLFWAPTAPQSVDLLPDGRVIFDGMSGRQNLREYSLAGKTPPRWLTRGNINDRQPVFSPDGEWVVFSSNRSGNLDLWTVSTRTGAIRSITEDAAEDWDPGFTPDGRHLLWSSNRSGAFEIWTAAIDGTGARQVSQDGEDAENPTETKDGKWVVYTSANRAKQGLWKIHLDGSGAQLLVSGTTILLPEVSPDGQYALYQKQANSLDVTIMSAGWTMGRRSPSPSTSRASGNPSSPWDGRGGRPMVATLSSRPKTVVASTGSASRTSCPARTPRPPAATSRGSTPTGSPNPWASPRMAPRWCSRNPNGCSA
jgi:Tol biopolymer transport system component